ncbi:hypothetical protein ACFYY8_33720 [Streptosporangium sp. NPDC001559]|uniref:hypothetical protein n=1 Tax=Streptosporangium sp. NPDC001559 TaxID=3366187 RepID=UPI0036E40DD2
MTGRIAPARRALTYAHHPLDGDKTVCGLDTTDPGELWQTVPPDAMVPTCRACQGEEEPPTLDAIAWLEEQADTYKAQLGNPTTARTLPTAPDHLTYPGAKPLGPKASTIAQDLRA